MNSPGSSPAGAPISRTTPAPISITTPAPISPNFAAPIPEMSSATVTVNNACYTGSPSDTFKLVGDGGTMVMSTVGGVITCICCILFAYISTTSPSIVPKIIAVCCVLSLATNIQNYYSAKMDIDALTQSGKIHACTSGPQPATTL